MVGRTAAAQVQQVHSREGLQAARHSARAIQVEPPQVLVVAGVVLVVLVVLLAGVV
jgi:hypothetical protein